MATTSFDDVFKWETLKSEWKAMWRDPGYLVFMFIFVIGALSIISSINTTFPLLGPAVGWLRSALMNVGPLLRGFLAILVVVLVFQLIYSFLTHQLDAIGLIPGWLLLTVLMFFMYYFITFLPFLLGTGQAGNVFASQSIFVP